jgi:hypothetical protein
VSDVDVAALAASLRAAAEEVEPAVTAVVQSAVEAAGGELIGLDHRLKTAVSIAEKITRRRGASDIEDLIRYTVVTADDRYLAVNNGLFEALTAMDVVMLERVAGWRAGGAYKGMNHVLELHGHSFEVQMHTASSYAAVKAARSLYEERRRPGTSNRRQRELRRQEAALFEVVPWPPGVPQIP